MHFASESLGGDFSSNRLYMRVMSVMSRVSQCLRPSGRSWDVAVCGFTSPPRWLWNGSGTHFLGCGDVFCLRSDAL